MSPAALASAALSLLVLSAMLSGSETAFFSLTEEERRRLGERGDWNSRAARSLLARRQNLLMTVLLSNLLVNLLYLSLGTELGLSLRAAGSTSAATGVLAGVVLLLVLVGEVVPKTLCQRHPLLVVRTVAVPVVVVERAMLPAVLVLGRLTDWLGLRILGPSRVESTGREDLLRLTDVLREKGVLAEGQRRFLHEALEFSELKVRDVMVPRVDVASIDLRAVRGEALQRIQERKVSRLLACDGHLDRVAGVLLAHEVVLRADRPLRELVRPVPAVPEIGTAAGAMTLLREEGATLAQVVDEHGGTAGILTMHDLVAEILGELADEHRRPRRNIVERAAGNYLVAGKTTLRQWRESTGSDEQDEGSATVAGMVLRRLDRLPREGDRVETAWFEYRVRQLRGRRVLLVEARRRPLAGPEHRP